MSFRIASACLACACALWGGENKTPVGQTANEALDLHATLYNDKESIRQLVGSDLGGYIVVLDVRVAPKGAKPLLVSRDDFLLRSDKDGQRSRPFHPSQIAGRGTLVVSESGRKAGVMSEDRGPVFGGGYPGSRPARLGGQSGAIGNTGESSAQATAQMTGKNDDDPLLATLKAKELREGEAVEARGGLLYFLMEGKHKTKQLELMYGGPAGKLSVRFKE